MVTYISNHVLRGCLKKITFSSLAKHALSREVFEPWKINVARKNETGIDESIRYIYIKNNDWIEI